MEKRFLTRVSGIKQLIFAALLLFISNGVFAQVTTSSIGGVIKDKKTGETLIGANVVATHVPSGTRYAAVTDGSGRFFMPAVRVGGPYQIVSTYVGYQETNQEDVFTSLGTTANVNLVMAEAGTTLDVVVVSYKKNDVFSGDRTGAATNVNAAQINALPTISRSINDYTRLTPQAQSGSGFGGRDGRYNNIQIDGANFNNNFGLSSTNLPGGGSQPISLDAIEEVQINIAPYDVRQSNFTGAGINAVTRSGTNEMQGSAYTFYRNQDFNGRKIGSETLAAFDKTTSVNYGARLGGAIIKNKLFFFANLELENNTRPGISFIPSAPGRSGSNVSRTTLDDMQKVSDYVRSKYNYETGASEGYASNFNTKNYKALARLDWNINDVHKLTVRYNQMVATDDQVINGTSAPNPRSSSNRISQNSYAFENSNYGFENSVKSLTGELNSLFSNKFSNQFLVTYTRIQDKRTSKSSPFPFVDIKKDNDSYLSLGYELFSWKNDVINNVTTITNNFNYYAGKHTLTAGFAFDYLTFGNSFQRYGTSYYRYSSVDAFLNNAAPEAFAITYTLQPDGSDPYAKLDFGLGGLYLQDGYNVSDRLKITAGLRVDKPFYFNDLQKNAAINALNFTDPLGTTATKIDVSQWPSSKLLFSPRLGFNYDIKGNKEFQVRGGTGIFTGRVPFVWFTNMPTNSGMLQNTIELTGSSLTAQNITFNADPKAYVSKFPQTAGTSVPGSIAAIDQNFKLPQVWRSNLALDMKLPSNTVFTFEALYSKDMNAIVQYNANQKAPVGKMNANGGKDTRPFFGATNADRRINSSMSEAIILSNTKQGYSYSLTGQLSKRIIEGLNAMVAYTYTNSKDVSGNPGAQAASAWSNNLSVRGQNDLDLSYSQYAVPHRVIGSMSYKLEWLKNFATTVSLFYEGAHAGRFSYRYTADFNRDGINSDLIYVPSSPSEITFTDIKSGTTTLFTAQQQSDAFFKYIEQDPYLNQNKGKYADREGVLIPWRNRFDLRFLQDIYTNINGKKNTLQLSLDVLNIGNLINPSWGVLQTPNYSNGGILVPTVAADGTATFQMARVDSKLPTSTFRNVLASSTTWGMQVGLRYIFN